MNSLPDHETWLIDEGDAIIERRVKGFCLSAVERLVYCLWVADYGIRNAGDLDVARDIHSNFQTEAAELAAQLGLLFTQQSFELPTEHLEAEYLDRFDRICAEIRGT